MQCNIFLQLSWNLYSLWFEQFFCHQLSFVFFLSTELLYIVVCTYKSVIGLGHNSTKPVAILYEWEWVQQPGKGTKGSPPSTLPSLHLKTQQPILPPRWPIPRLESLKMIPVNRLSKSIPKLWWVHVPTFKLVAINSCCCPQPTAEQLRLAQMISDSKRDDPELPEKVNKVGNLM